LHNEILETIKALPSQAFQVVAK